MTQRNIRGEVIQFADDGLIDKDYLINALVNYLSTEDLRDCLRANDIILQGDLDED